MKVIRNFFWNAGYQVFVLLVPLVTIPYVNRVLGPTGIGINSYTNSIVQYFILFGSLGINIYGNREIAYTRDSKDEMSSVFWELSILRFIMIGLSTGLYLIFIFISQRYRTFYFLQGIMLIGTAFDISWLFMGVENFRVTVLRNALVKILALICTFAFVKTAQDTWIYILILAGSQGIGYLTLWPQLIGLVNRPRLSNLHVMRHIRPSVTLLIPQIATQVYLQLNKTMLGVFQGVQASGYYDNSDKIIKMVLAIVTATGTVLLPHVAHSFARGEKKAVQNSLIVSMHVVMALAIPMSFGLAAVSHPFTLLFFSSKFSVVAPLMAVESIVIILIGISNAVGTQYLLPTNQLKSFTTSVILGSVVNIILNIPLILLMGTMGAILATVISEASVSAFQLWRIKDQISVRDMFFETWKYILAATVMFVSIHGIQSFMYVSIIHVMVQVAFGVVTYCICLAILRPRFLYHQIQKVAELSRHKYK